MNKNEKPSFFRSKSAAVGIVICFVAVIAMVGAFTFNNYEKQMDGDSISVEICGFRAFFQRLGYTGAAPFFR